MQVQRSVSWLYNDMIIVKIILSVCLSSTIQARSSFIAWSWFGQNVGVRVMKPYLEMTTVCSVYQILPSVVVYVMRQRATNNNNDDLTVFYKQ